MKIYLYIYILFILIIDFYRYVFMQMSIAMVGLYYYIYHIGPFCRVEMTEVLLLRLAGLRPKSEHQD